MKKRGSNFNSGVKGKGGRDRVHDSRAFYAIIAKYGAAKKFKLLPNMWLKLSIVPAFGDFLV